MIIDIEIVRIFLECLVISFLCIGIKVILIAGEEKPVELLECIIADAGFSVLKLFIRSEFSFFFPQNNGI